MPSSKSGTCATVYVWLLWPSSTSLKPLADLRVYACVVIVVLMCVGTRHLITDSAVVTRYMPWLPGTCRGCPVHAVVARYMPWLPGTRRGCPVHAVVTRYTPWLPGTRRGYPVHAVVTRYTPWLPGTRRGYPVHAMVTRYTPWLPGTCYGSLFIMSLILQQTSCILYTAVSSY